MKNFKKAAFGILSALLVTFVIFSCSDDSNVTESQVQETKLSQRPYRPCPEGMEPGMEKELETHKFHRASKGCMSGFSICRTFKWVPGCVPTGKQEVGIAGPESGMVTIYSIHKEESNQLQLIFPIGLMQDSELINEDLSVFYVEDELMFEDFKVKTGAYPTIIKKYTIEVLIDLK